MVSFQNQKRSVTIMKRITSLLLAFSMLLTLFPFSALAEDAAVPDGASVQPSPAPLELPDLSEELVQQVLPAETAPADPTDDQLELLDANTVIDGAVFGAEGNNLSWSLTAGGLLTISGSGKSDDWERGYDAPWYDHSEDITEAVVEEGVTWLDPYSFRNLDSLRKISLPSTADFSYSQFSSCEKLTEILIAEGNEEYQSIDGLLYSADGTTLWVCPRGKVGAVTLPEGVTSLSYMAFQNCSAVTQVTLSADVKEISSEAFAYSGVTAFLVDEANESFSSREGMLCNASGSTLVCCPPGLTGTVTVPEGIKIVGSYAFRGGKLSAVELPASMTYIMDEVFLDCDGLTAITVSAENKMFSSKEGLLLSKDGTTLLCCPPALESLILPEGITTLEETAFQSCWRLNRLTLPDSMTTFTNTLYSDCNNLQAILVSEEHPAFTSVDGILYSKDGTKLLCCPGGMASPAIAPGTQIIAANAFRNVWSDALLIPASVTVIEKNAFYNGGAKAVYYTGSKSQWGEMIVFGGNDDLINADITFDHQEATFTWEFDEKTGTLTFSGTGVVDYFGLTGTPWRIHRSKVNLVVLEEGITGVGKNAFYNYYNLSSVEIPASLTDIAHRAFAKSYNIDMVLYGGTQSQWESITIGKENDYLTDATLVYAEDTLLKGETNGSSWTLDRNTGTLTICGENSYVNGSQWDGLRTQVKTLILEEGITEIDGFSKWPLLESISFPASLTYMSAFYNCDQLTTVILPAGLQSFNSGSFRDCDKLTQVLVSGENPYFRSVDGVLYNNAMTNLRKYPAGKSGSFTVPGTVTEIGSQAFYGSDLLTAVTLPTGLTYIRSSAFSGCTGLTQVNIPQGVTTISDSAFYGCTDLASVTLPHGLTTIYSGAFADSGLTEITVPASVTRMDGSVFSDCSALTRATLLCQVNELTSTFHNCSALETVTLPASLTQIGTDSFYQCDSLKTVHYGGSQTLWESISIQSEGNEALDKAEILFGGTDTVLSGMLNDSVSWTLDPATGRLTVSGSGGAWPENDSPWHDLVNLTSVVFEEGITNINADLFCGSYLEEVFLPASVIEVSENAFRDCVHLKSITVDEDNARYYDDDGVLILRSANADFPHSETAVRIIASDSDLMLYLPEDVPTKAEESLICYPAAREGESYTVPDSVTSIVYASFADCSSLKTLTLPDTLTELSQKAFLDSFSLERIVLEGENDRYFTEDGLLYAKAGDGRRVLLAYPAGQTQRSFTIPDDVVAAYFPYKGSLTDLTVPGGVQFLQMGRTITDVTYAGTEELWDIVVTSYSSNITFGDTLSTLSGSVGTVQWEFDPETNTLILSGTGAIPDYPPCPLPGYDHWAPAPWSYIPVYAVDHIVVKEGITAIGDYAFAAFNEVESLSLADSIQSLGTLAFRLNSDTAVCIPAGVTQMNGISLGNAQEITLSSQNTAFRLEDDILLTADGKTLVASFDRRNYSGYAIPKGVTTIGAYAFYDSRYWIASCPDSLTTVESFAFYNARNLDDLTLPQGVTSVGSYAFYRSTLYSLDIDAPDFVPQEHWYITGIGQASNLRRIYFAGTFAQWETFGADVQSVYPGVAVYCQDSDSPDDDTAPYWYFDSATSTIHLAGSGDFYESTWANLANKAKAIHIEAGITYFYEYLLQDTEYQWPLLTQVTVEAGNTRYFDQDGVLFERDGTADLIYYPDGRTDTSYTVPNITAQIGYRAFKNPYLQRITIPGTVTSIEENNFNRCSALQEICVSGSGGYSAQNGVLFDSSRSRLMAYPPAREGSSYTVPATVTSIVYAAFADAASLQSITLPDKLKSIGSYAFDGCSSLESLTIPEGITRLESHTASGCDSLETVALPGTLMVIYEDAFLPNDPTHVIDTVTFNGSQLLWDAVSVEVGNEALTANLRAVGTKTKFSGTTEDGQSWTLDPTTGELIISGTGTFWDTDLFRNSCATSVTVKEGVTGLNCDFYNTNFTALSLPATMNDLFNRHGLPDTLERITVAKGNPSYWDDDGVLMEIFTEEVGPVEAGEPYYQVNSANIFASSAELVLYEVPQETRTVQRLAYYPASRPDTAYTVPKQVTHISSSAFTYEYPKYLTSLTLPKDLQVTDSADALRSLANLPALTAIEVADGHPTLFSQDGVLFRRLNETQSELLCYPDGLTQDYYEIPDGVIAARLSNSYLDTVSVPQNMMDLDRWYNTNVIYRGTKDTFSGSFGDGFTWRYDNGTLTISGSGAMPDFAIEDHTPWERLSADVTHIRISEGITHIGDLSFLSLFSVESVTLPDSLESIGTGAFYLYDLPAALHIPAGVTGLCASSLKGFESVTLDKGNTAFVLEDEMLLTADRSTLVACLTTEPETIPQGITAIAPYAFFMVESTSIKLPETLKSIGAYAFHSCDRLSGLVLPASVETVGIGALYGCHELAELTVSNPAMRPDDYWFVTSIGYTDLDTVNFGGGSGLWKDASAGLSDYYRYVDVNYAKPPALTAAWDCNGESLVVYGKLDDLVCAVVAFYTTEGRLIQSAPMTAKQLSNGASFWPEGYTEDTCKAQIFLLDGKYAPMADRLLP